MYNVVKERKTKENHNMLFLSLVFVLNLRKGDAVL